MTPFLLALLSVLMVILSTEADYRTDANNYMLLAAIFFAASLVIGALQHGRSQH